MRARRLLLEPCLRARCQGQSPQRGVTRACPAADLRVAPALQRAARQRGFHRQEGHRRHLHRPAWQRDRAAGQHRGSGRLLLQQRAVAAAVGHRHALRAAHRQRSGRPQLLLPARRLGAGVLRRSRVQSVHRRRPGQHVDRRVQRRPDRPWPARLYRGRLYEHRDERCYADQGQAGAARHAAVGPWNGT